MSETGLSEAAHQLVAAKGVDAVVEEAASSVPNSSSASASSDAKGSHAESSTVEHPKTDKLIQDVKVPIDQMKGCGTIVVLIACCVVVIASTFMQWVAIGSEAAQRQQIYESIQVMQAQQTEANAKLDLLILAHPDEHTHEGKEF